MTNRFARIRTTAAVLAVGGLATAGAAGLAGDPGGTNPARPVAETVALHANQAIDTSDDRRLVGFADDVFVGEVLARTGQTSELAVPETQYSVRVLEVVKGALAGTVTVNQFGGDKGGRPVRLDGDELLEPGQTYLFATRTRTDRGWHTLVANHGDVKVRGDAHREQLRRRFAAAHERQVVEPAG